MIYLALFLALLATPAQAAPAIPIVAAVAGAAATSAIGAGILGSIVGTLVAGAINMVGGRIFAKKPKAPAFSADAQGRTSVVRSSVESHKVIYGQAKVSGPLVYVGTTNDGPSPAGGPKENKFLHYIIPVAGHEVEEIGTVTLNDVALTLDTNGFATNTPYYKTTTTNVTIAAAISTIARAAGTVTVTTGSDHGFQVGETVTINAQSISPSFDGVFTIASTPTSTTFTYASGGNGGSSILGGSASVVRSTTSSSSYVVVRKKLGAADQAADDFAVANIPDWTLDHRLRGIAYLYIRMEWNPDLFPSGPPNIAAVVKGKKVYDPRTDTTAWSDNSALCIRDYLANDYGFNCDDDEINDTYFIAAANVCDESVTLKDGGSQSRYTCNGVVDTAVAPLDNLAALVSSLAGAITYVQGKFRCHAGAYDAPSGDLDTSMLAGGVTIRARTSRKELFNAVKGTYVDPERNWQPTDFPPVTSVVYEAQDGGEQIFRDLELPFTNHPEMAQRIAKLIREKARQGITVEMPVNHSALQFSVFDTVRFTDDQLGFNDKVFRIHRFSTTGTGPVKLTLQEESSASYDWDGTTEAVTIDAAPDTNLPNPLHVEPPGTPLVTEALYATTDGSGVKAKATLTWHASTDAFLREYQAEYKSIADAEYIKLPRTTATTQEVIDIAPGTYNFQVKAVNNLGVSSAYAPTTQVMYGLTDAPAQVRNFSLNAIGGAAHLSWNQATDLDVLIAGTVRIRHSALTTGANWNSAIDIGQALPGISTQAVLPLLDGTYLAKFIDSVGNPSVNPATLSATLVSFIEMNVVETLSEGPDFTGEKSGVVFDSDLGGLKLTGNTNWDDYPGNIDDWPRIDNLGGIATSGIYTFSEGIDLGAVYPCRVSAAISAISYDTGDTIDQRLTNFDTWASFDGTGLSDFSFADALNVDIIPNYVLGPNSEMASFIREQDTTTTPRVTEDKSHNGGLCPNTI